MLRRDHPLALALGLSDVIRKGQNGQLEGRAEGAN